MPRNTEQSRKVLWPRVSVSPRGVGYALCSAVAHRRMRTTDVRRSPSPFVGITPPIPEDRHYTFLAGNKRLKGRISRLPDILPLLVSYYPAESREWCGGRKNPYQATVPRNTEQSRKVLWPRVSVSPRGVGYALCSAVAHRRMRTTDVRRSLSPFVGITPPQR